MKLFVADVGHIGARSGTYFWQMLDKSGEVRSAMRNAWRMEERVAEGGRRNAVQNAECGAEHGRRGGTRLVKLDSKTAKEEKN